MLDAEVSTAHATPSPNIRPGDAGVVDKDVDAAERLHSGVARSLDIGESRDIAHDRRGFAKTAQIASGLLGQRGIAIPDRDGANRSDVPLLTGNSPPCGAPAAL